MTTRPSSSPNKCDLRLRHPSPLVASQNDDTALILASKEGRLQIVQTLVAAGADKGAKNKVGDAVQGMALTGWGDMCVPMWPPPMFMTRRDILHCASPSG